MSDTLDFRSKKLPELRDICRSDNHKYYGFSKLNKQDLINFMYQRNSTQQRRYRTNPSYDISDVSHIFETQDERDERISELEEIISDLSSERPEDSVIQDLVSSLRREYPRCNITFDENKDEYSDMIYKGNKGKYIKKYGNLGECGEKILYHGTDEKNLLSILSDDFRLTSNPVHGNVYGKGIYFTNDIDKAIYYSERSKSTKYILVCNVHVGDICLGNARMDVHPKMPNGDKTYDTSVDNMHSPKQFIKKKGIKKFTLIGNSMGGAISMKYSELYPFDLNNLILISTSSHLCSGIENEFSKLVSQGENPLISNTVQDFEKSLDFIMYERNYVPGPILEVMAEKKNKKNN